MSAVSDSGGSARQGQPCEMGPQAAISEGQWVTAARNRRALPAILVGLKRRYRWCE